ncbi:phage tail protein [bacterium]|nr:phage tail protein [Chloroflexi bacterium CFX6]RIL12708.1 MAG: phage tail protein [bacterium]
MPPKDPYRNFNFLVEIDGIQQAGFTECTGFGADNAPIEYREGGDNLTVRKLPGLTKYPNIVLKWGITDSQDLYNWFRDITRGKVERKNVSIVLRDIDGSEKIRWNAVLCWPTKWDGPDFNAKGTDVAIETLELAHEGVERA